MTEAKGAAMPLYRAEGPSLSTTWRRMLKTDPVVDCCSRILSVSSGYPVITPAVPPNPPATNSLPQLLARNSGQKSICSPTLRWMIFYTTRPIYAQILSPFSWNPEKKDFFFCEGIEDFNKF